MRLRNALGIHILNEPTGFSIHLPHLRREVEPDVLMQPGFLALITFCQEWRTREAVNEFLSSQTQLDSGDRENMLSALVEVGVLIEDTEVNLTLAKAYDNWESFGWGDPFVFQLHIDNLQRLDYADGGKAVDIARMRKYLEEDPVPDNYKILAGSKKIPLLRDVEIDHESVFALLAEENEIGFPNRALSFKELSWMTYLGYGQTDTHSTYYGERLAKTSPSGGARHPTEVYLLVLDDVELVNPGAYHYSVKEHALELIEEGDFSEVVQQGLLRQPGLAPFQHRLAYITGSRFERTMWRYRESFSYRSSNHDLGHLMETTRLLARAIKRNHFRGFAPKESLIEPLLKLDGIEEAAMTFSIIG